MWLFRSDFPGFSESAEIWQSTLFVLKKVPVVSFFKNAEEYGQNCMKLMPPLPLSISKQHRISILESQKTLCMCLLRYWREVGVARSAREGGWTFKNVFEALFPPLVEKETQGHFSQKRSWHAKFQRILEQLGKSLQNSHIGPACTEPFNYYVDVRLISSPGRNWDYHDSKHILLLYCWRTLIPPLLI